MGGRSFLALYAALPAMSVPQVRRAPLVSEARRAKLGRVAMSGHRGQWVPWVVTAFRVLPANEALKGLPDATDCRVRLVWQDVTGCLANADRRGHEARKARSGRRG